MTDSENPNGATLTVSKIPDENKHRLTLTLAGNKATDSNYDDTDRANSGLFTAQDGMLHRYYNH